MRGDQCVEDVVLTAGLVVFEGVGTPVVVAAVVVPALIFGG